MEQKDKKKEGPNSADLINKDIADLRIEMRQSLEVLQEQTQTVTAALRKEIQAKSTSTIGKEIVESEETLNVLAFLATHVHYNPEINYMKELDSRFSPLIKAKGEKGSYKPIEKLLERGQALLK